METRQLTLHLFQPLCYRKFENDSEDETISQAYDRLFELLEKAETGCECIMKIGYDITCDSMSLKKLSTGYAQAPTEEIKALVDKGLPIPVDVNADIAIDCGNYRFIQFPWTPDGTSVVSNISSTLYSLGLVDSGNIYLRLLKENALIIVLQMIVSEEKRD